MPRLTKTLVDRMRPGTLWDDKVSGFGVRRQAVDGVPSFLLKTRIDGRQRFITIGRMGSPWTVETARDEALRLLTAARHGTDVAEERQAARKRGTLADITALYLEQHGPKLKPRTREEYERLLRTTILPAFGTHTIDAIWKSDISRLHSSLAKTPRKANFAIAVLSSIIAWATEHRLRPDNLVNPCVGLRKFRENAKERFLSTDELARLLAVLDQLDATNEEMPSVTTAIRLLLLTGARLNEILTLKWQYIDRERATAWLPDSKTGKKALHLSEQALDVLSHHPNDGASPYVIVGRDGTGHLINLQKPWRRIRALASIPDVRIHDLRHSYASIAINSGASLAMVGKLLGHRQPQTTMRYSHLTDDRVREVNAKVGSLIARAVRAKA